MIARIPPRLRLLGALLVLTPCAALAQSAAPGDSAGATTLLPPDHWVFPILGRLDALGTLPATFDPTAPSWTRGDAMRALRAAAETEGLPGAGEVPGRPGEGGVRLALAAAEALEAESRADGPARAPAVLPGWAAVVHAAAPGSLLAGYDTSAAGPPVAPVEAGEANELALEALVAARAAPWLAAELNAGVATGGIRLTGAHALVRLPWSLLAWAGRRHLAMPVAAESPGLLVGPPRRLDGVGAALTPGRALPRPLAWLGPVNLELLLSRLDGAGATASPWLWALHGSVRPHPRLRFGMQRAALMGGVGNVELGLRQVLEMLVGTHGDSSAVDNQILALDAWYRPPLGPLPLALYLSWAMDDASGAWLDVPAYLAGAQIAALPGLPAVALSLERVSFTGSCCGNPPWYRHLQLPWLDGRRPMGHPLAGHGEEWRARGRLDLPGRGVLSSMDTFVRDRGHENLLAPDRAGSSRGAELRLRYRPPGRALEIAGSASIEAGRTGWHAYESALSARIWLW